MKASGRKSRKWQPSGGSYEVKAELHQLFHGFITTYTPSKYMNRCPASLPYSFLVLAHAAAEVVNSEENVNKPVGLVWQEQQSTLDSQQPNLEATWNLVTAVVYYRALQAKISSVGSWELRGWGLGESMLEGQMALRSRGRIQFAEMCVSFGNLFQQYFTFGSISRSHLFMMIHTFRHQLLWSLRKPSCVTHTGKCSCGPWELTLILKGSPGNKSNQLS